MQPILVFAAAILVPVITILGAWATTRLNARDERATIAADLGLLERLPADSGAAKALERSVHSRIFALSDPPRGWSLQRAIAILGVVGVLFGVVAGVFIERTDYSYVKILLIAYLLGTPVVALSTYRMHQRLLWLRQRRGARQPNGTSIEPAPSKLGD